MGSEELEMKDKTRSRKQMKPEEKSSERKEMITAEGKHQTDDSMRERREGEPDTELEDEKIKEKKERRGGLGCSVPPGKPKRRSG